MAADLHCCSSLLIQRSGTFNIASLAYEEIYWFTHLLGLVNVAKHVERVEPVISAHNAHHNPSDTAIFHNARLSVGLVPWAYRAQSPPPRRIVRVGRTHFRENQVQPLLRTHDS
jgi:hypothetical protein